MEIDSREIVFIDLGKSLLEQPSINAPTPGRAFVVGKCQRKCSGE
jgi:hypothetical protein